MHSRCYKINHRDYRNYGARGIIVCDRWHGRDGFQNFLADMGEKPPGLSIDRVNNDGPYAAWNCRWSDLEQQNWNRRTTIWVSLAGEIIPTREAIRRLGISRASFLKRMRTRGETPQQAVDHYVRHGCRQNPRDPITGRFLRGTLQ